MKGVVSRKDDGDGVMASLSSLCTPQANGSNKASSADGQRRNEHTHLQLDLAHVNQPIARVTHPSHGPTEASTSAATKVGPFHT